METFGNFWLIQALKMQSTREKGSQQKTRSCPGQGWQETTWSKHVCVRRPRGEEARGKEGREESALWKEGGDA